MSTTNRVRAGHALGRSQSAQVIDAQAQESDGARLHRRTSRYERMSIIRSVL